MEARQTPTYSRNIPRKLDGDGEDAAALGEAFFGEPLPWQRYLLDVMLARNARDKYQCKTIGISVPRQNGKSWALRARCFYGAAVIGERILFTCHHGDTADTMFKELADIFEDEENEELHGLLKSVRRTNGQQAIYLNNGGFIRFTTRTGSLGRGKSYDVLICDEAQEMTYSQQEACKPTISASRLHNAQTIYTGTPPGPDCCGTVFRSIRERVINKKSNATWIEWSVSSIGNVRDKKRWYETNPSLGALLDVESVEGEVEDLTPDGFARERLGWWSEITALAHAISKKAWGKAEIEAIAGKYRKKTAFGLKFSSDGQRYALVGCKQNAKGEAAVEIVELGTTEFGTKDLAKEIHDRRSKVSAIAVDGLSAAGAFCKNMEELRAPKRYVMSPTPRDVVGASAGFVDSLADGSVKHTGQPALTDSATGCVKRAIGNGGGWGFAAEGSHDPTAIEAAVLALWAVRTTKRDPKRKQRML